MAFYLDGMKLDKIKIEPVEIIRIQKQTRVGLPGSILQRKGHKEEKKQKTE